MISDLCGYMAILCLENNAAGLSIVQLSKRAQVQKLVNTDKVLFVLIVLFIFQIVAQGLNQTVHLEV